MILQKTYLSSMLDGLDSNRARYDDCVKCLLADPQVLARILKYTVPEFAHEEIDAIMECIGEPTVSITAPKESYQSCVESVAAEDNDIQDGKIIYDIRFPAYVPNEGIKMLVNIEAQNCTGKSKLKYHLGNRIVYYMSRLVSTQKNTEFTGSDYDNIKKVYSIWICMDAKDGGDSIISIGLDEKVCYGIPEWRPDVDLMQGFIINIRKRGPVRKSQNKLIGMLEELLSKDDSYTKKRRLEEDYGIRLSVEGERSEQDMCNLSERVWEEGLEQGLEQGRARAVSDAIQKIVAKLDVTAEQAMDILEVPKEERKKLVQQV